MQNIKEGAEVVQESMSFMQEFLQKKYAWGIVFFGIIIGGLITAIAFYSNGKKEGKESATAEVKSLKESGKNDSASIRRLKFDVYDLQMKLDTCNKSSASTNLEELVTKKLEEAERLKRLIERKIANDEKLNNNLKTVLK